MSVARELEGMPAPVAAAEKYFQQHGDPEGISGMYRVKDGKASGLMYIPPVDPTTLELILNLVSGMVKPEVKAATETGGVRLAFDK